MSKVPLSIDLDFLPGRRRSSNWLGWMLFIIGVITFFVAVAEYRVERGVLAQEVEEIDRLRKALRRTSAAPTSGASVVVSSDEVLAALDTAKRLNISWGGMFSGLTAAQSASASWISLDVEPERSRLRIIGDASSLPAIFEFMTHLHDADRIGEVSLSSYERLKVGSSNVIRFNISANWSGE